MKTILNKKTMKTILNKIKKLYAKIDKGDPSWLSIFKSIRIKIEISFRFPFREWKKDRSRNKLIKIIMPDYVSLRNGWIFLHKSSIPEGSDAIMELRKIVNILNTNGFEKSEKIKADMNDIGHNSFSSYFKHNKYGGLYLIVYFSNTCDIKYKKETVKTLKLTGMCAKVLEELNKN